ncbi:sulfur carrier protein ThiS [Anaerofustis stercorihominis]|uniref:Thiamine biosynthesis protein ThiS n=1 Tax=Anaerofustis stercorihominis DSM 17244 TaxID=445971 RepID=B1CBK8_9FIRM|nr:sulfur carrier protein ThiS [Anaerofustis stercorihominis]EDS71655.1 thiamine biosynthesis protein ThiS [Anaerofustis stercorihominis DSM 17244]MCQ4796287.1 sulfur carrier protein ThiS [Anaerofustis stercorihominis]
MIRVNGESFDFKDINLKELLLKLQYDSSKVAIELNEEIVSKNDYEKVIIKDDDKLEVVSFVGGG